MREKKDLRLFFALWPDEETRQRITDLMTRFDISPGARLVTRSNLHMTLHFVGNCSFAQMECYKEKAAGVSGEGFELHIDKVGYFKKPKVLWLGCERLPQPLLKLHRQLGSRLASCDYTPESRPYNPHVSIARFTAAPKVSKFDSIPWRVDRFVLVESRSVAGAVDYQVIDEFALGED